jgi:GTP-binding protein
MPLPKLVIVGRPNVGKSSLLNMLARRRVSIVDAQAGVTRDRVSAIVTIPGEDPGAPEHAVELIDTGGYGIEDPQNLTAEVEQQIERGLSEADLVLFMVDAQAGPTPLDERFAKLLRRADYAQKPMLMIANKVDADNQVTEAYQCMQLGFGEPVMLSTTTGYNKPELYDRIHEAIDLAHWPEDTDPENAEGIRLALVGKRNAGKSTLVNALAGDDRVIVSEQAGTTRDAVDVRFEMEDRVFTAIDTAGVQRRKSIGGDLGFYSHHRALRSVRRADVCLLIIDASVPISQTDRQLVQEIVKHHRPTVIVVSKWDLAEASHGEEEYAHYFDDQLKALSYAPIVFTSANQGDGLKEALEMAGALHDQARQRVTTGELNQAIEKIMAERGPRAKGGKPGKVYYATQTDIDPPTIVLFVNDAAVFDENYQRFLINRFRDLLPFPEVPIKLRVRDRQRLDRIERRRART